MKNLFLAVSLSLSLSAVVVKSIHAQETPFMCLLEDDDAELSSLPGSDSLSCVQHSINGHTLPSSGVIRVLIVFGQIQYTDASFDPNPNTNTNWPLNALPNWANDLFDSQPLATPQGKLTKYFHDASSGNLTVLGDILLAPGTGIFTIPDGGYQEGHTSLINAVNIQSNGVFVTQNQLQVADFDMWQKTGTGQPKINLPNNPHRYDCVMFVWRNWRTWNGTYNSDGNPNYVSYNGTGNASFFGFGTLMMGHGADTHMNFGTYSSIPVAVARHEIAHLIMGANNFHCAGGGTQANYWIPHTGGHSMLGLAGSALSCWNAWDRYWMGWKPSVNAFEISARNSIGAEVNGDLDATDSNHAGTYILRDFVATGDALRVKLPFLDQSTEYQQWLWLENHRGAENNGNEFDQFLQHNNSCLDPITWGLCASVQIDRENRCGSSIYAGGTTSNAGHADYIRMFSADGMWEREFDATPSQDPCIWSFSNYPSTKISENPLTGFSDLDRHPFDFNNNGLLVEADQMGIYAENSGASTNWKMYLHGNPRQFFRIGGNDRLAISTNPPSSNRMSFAGQNTPLSNSLNVRSINLNGLQVKILNMLPNGDIKVEIKFDHVEVDQDVRWCAPDIVLNEIPTTHGNSLVLKQDKVLLLDHGTAATRMNNPIDFENQQVFTDPTTMHVRDGAFINLEEGSEMVIDRRSTLKLESGSVLYVHDGATLRIRREGKLELLDGALLQVEEGGKVIVEGNTSGYSRGSIVYREGARINLEGSGAHLDVAGLLRIEDNAVFRLSQSADLNRTLGQIIFRAGMSTQVTAGINTSWAVLGYSPTQLVILNQKDNLGFTNTMVNFVIRDLQVSQSPACRIVPPVSNACNIVVRDVSFRDFAGHGHNGLGLYGQNQVTIRNCNFYNANVGIYCFNVALGNGLTVRDSYFENCTTGISTYSRSLILYDTEFFRCDQDWYALAMTGTSGMQNVNAQSTTFTNVHFSGNATLLGEFSYFSGGNYGIQLDAALARLRCIDVKAQNTSAMNVINGGSLVMNGAWPGNDLSGNAMTIALNQATELNLNNGRNDLRPNTFGTQSIVNGSFICPAVSNLTANQNVWNNSGTAPPSGDYLISGNCPPQIFFMTISDNTPQSQMAACQATGLPEGEGEMSAMDGSQTSDSEAESGDLASLLEMMHTDAFADMFFTSAADDQIATSSTAEFQENMTLQSTIYNGLYEVLDASLSITDDNAEEHFLAGASLIELYQRSHFLANLEPASTDASIPTIAQVHDALKNLSETFAATDQTAYAFWTGIWAAEVLHTAGNTNAALSYLLSEAPTSYDDVSEMVFNRFSCQMEYELVAEFPTYEDWKGQVDLCEGAAIDDAKSGDVGKDSDKLQADSKLINVFPNPNSGQFNLDLSGDVEEVQLNIYDLKGRKLGQINKFKGGQVDISSLSGGIYIMNVYNETCSEQVRISIIK